MDEILKMSKQMKDVKDLDSLKSAIGNNSDGLFMGFSMYGIFFGFVFSMIGLIYFRLGKKNQRMPVMILGIALMVYPYFITNTVGLFVVGLVLSLLPLFFKNTFSLDS